MRSATTGPAPGLSDVQEVLSVQRLVEAARAGDAESFGDLYDRYVESVYRYIYYRVGLQALAEDLTSETFLRALRRIADFRLRSGPDPDGDRDDFGAWLVTIARNLITDHFKSSRYKLEIPTAELLDQPHHSDPERTVLDWMTHRTVLAAVRKLGSEQRECVVLRFVHGLSVAETAEIMDKKTGAIKALQYRAVRSLARMLPSDLATA
jgi:RNA polymerase sigma-70 factor (TIGR02952 family)